MIEPFTQEEHDALRRLIDCPVRVPEFFDQDRTRTYYEWKQAWWEQTKMLTLAESALDKISAALAPR